MKRSGKLKININEAELALQECLKRFHGKQEKTYLYNLLRMLVLNNSIPIELLNSIPIHADEAKKTRFDQVYDAVSDLAFPSYREEILEKLLGSGTSITDKTKIWRAVFPPKFKLAHVLIRAESYQEAFALACDYACRASVRMFGRIPHDLTIRIMFVTEKALRRKLKLRWANRVNKRRQYQLIGRTFTNKEISGARIVALGNPNNDMYKIARYLEVKDLGKILKSNGLCRVSAIETEVFNKEI